MDANKVRMLMLAAAGAAALATATNAVACEQCKADNGHTGNAGICFDSFTTGGSCSGGQADNTWCDVGPQTCKDTSLDDSVANCVYKNWYQPGSCSTS